MPSRISKARAREKLGIPEGLSPELTEKFMIASLVVTNATGFAISRALRNNTYLLEQYRRGNTDQNNRIRLSPYDVDKLTKNAISYLPDCIWNRAQYEDDPEQAYKGAMKIFKGYSHKEQMEKIRQRMPKVLSTVCVMPESEPEA